MKHSHLFIALLIGNTLMTAYVVDVSLEAYFHTISGQGIALLLHWLSNLPKKKPVDL